MRPSVLAEKCGVKKSTVTRWDENKVPLKRVFDVEKATGIPREKLRPDFFKEAAINFFVAHLSEGIANGQ